MTDKAKNTILGLDTEAADTQAEILDILRADHIAASDWAGPVFFSGHIYISVNAMIEALAASGAAPSYAFAVKPVDPIPDAESILHFLFPDGIPSFEKVPRETSQALHNVISAVHKLARCDGIQRLKEDRETIIVIDAERFVSDLIENINKELS